MPRPLEPSETSRIAQAAQFRGHLYRDRAMAALEKSSYDEIDDVDEIPLSILDPPPPPRAQMPPLPDLRFEHSYMKSIANAETWYQVAWITFQTQVS